MSTEARADLEAARTVGILGGGQLGRMLALAGYPLGKRFIFLDPSAESPAGHLGELWVAAYDDAATLERLASRCRVVTYEFESVPVTAARALAEHVAVYPPPAALEVAQDRWKEKSFFSTLGIPTAAFASVSDAASLRDAVARIGVPSLLKTCRFGYDGKGQALVNAPHEAEGAWERVRRAPCILEQRVAFDRELSIITVRSVTGETATYPLVENRHEGGVLRLTMAPAEGVSSAVQATAARYAEAITKALDYVGVLAIELFDVGGELLVNEMAPRVHNSGHWTIEGAETSQFENHLRAILGLPLGASAAVGVSAMVNVLGELPPVSEVLRIPGAHLHLYGKEPVPGRKLGHVTVRAESREALAPRLRAVLETVHAA